MPASLVEVSRIFLVKHCGITDTKKPQKQQQHTNATENNTYGKTEFSGLDACWYDSPTTPKL